MKTRYFVSDIQYYLSDEDIVFTYPELNELSSDEDIDKHRQDLIRSLPKSMTIELPETIDSSDKDEVGDYLANFITDETGYLVDGFIYEAKQNETLA